MTVEITSKSWAPEVKVDGKWSGNGLRFSTKQEAESWGGTLLLRWIVPTDYRAVPSDDEVNYLLDENGNIQAVGISSLDKVGGL